MDSRTRASLLWGAVGALSFLVLAQGYRLVGDLDMGLPVLLIVAVGVFVVTTGLSQVVGRRLDRKRHI